MMRQIGAYIFVVLLWSSLSTAVDAEETIRIGWSGPLSGNSAVLGIDSVKAAQIAVAEQNAMGGIKGRKIELIVEDDRYDTARALSAYTKLVTVHKVVGILSSTYGGVFATAKRAKAEVDFFFAGIGFEIKSNGNPTKAQKVLLAECSQSFVLKENQLPIMACLVGED